MAIIGLDIGGTKILGALFDHTGEIVDKEKTASKGEEGHNVLMNQIYKVIDSLIGRSEEPVSGIGIGVPGTVSPEGVVMFSPNLPFEGMDLKTDIEEKYSLEVRVGNDVNLGTYGEYSRIDIAHANVIGLFPGTGLGGGIIIDGKLYIGKGFAGELGHIIVKKDGVKCGCGNKGCLESYASKKGILSYLKKQIKKGHKTVLKEDVKKGVLKSSKLKKAYQNKDKLTLEAMEQFYEYLGLGCGIIMNTFNPDLIIIGGGITESFGEELLDEIRIHAKKFTMPGVYEQTQIQKSQLADDAVVYGGYFLIKKGQ